MSAVIDVTELNNELKNDDTVIVAINDSGNEILGSVSENVDKLKVIEIIKRLTKLLGYCLTDISLRKGNGVQ